MQFVLCIIFKIKNLKISSTIQKMNSLRDILHFMSSELHQLISQRVFKQKKFYCSVLKSF